MSEHGLESEEPLAGWDPRRRAALEAAWDRFERAAGDRSLSDELMDERHRKAAAEDSGLAE
jgi:hypothetical protein